MWKIIGRRLGFEDPELQDIEQRYGKLCERGYHMLMDWKQEHGSVATYETLNAALQHKFVQRKDLAEKTCYKNDDELKIKVVAEHLRPKKPNMKTTTLATESGGCQEVQDQRASATLPTEGSVSLSGIDQALERRVMWSIARNYLQINPPKSSEELSEFMEYMRKMRVIIAGVSVQCLVITVKCESIQILDELWAEYSCGHLGTMVQNCFVTEKIMKKQNLAELKLITTMDIEEYSARKAYFERVALREKIYLQRFIEGEKNVIASENNTLYNTKQSVLINGELSEPHTITLGVPQGSILGPLLFNVYINSLPNAVKETRMILYADDAVLFCDASTRQELQIALEREFTEISNWYTDNRLTINVKKTKFMLAGSKRMLSLFEDFELQPNGTQIDRVQSFKYLGVTTDAKWSWKPHISNLLKKLGHRLSLFNRIFHMLDNRTRIALLFLQ
ncbi:putative RNA-directed DNA polymerase from transposon BS [Stylophora pistillata]|uniref:Putative RNA-directed DNA polymerase from transposon BS n=1 Tax=Stylophora pistillata TaxID=50429 RepID=A0A2B4S9W7_STYPI|nr:putative RNA-directed DNA polymerase from transposon BS [Stylophora pistillata]